MDINELKNNVLSLYRDSNFQKISAYYDRKTVFDILKVERNENRYSAFLCWLLDSTSNHGLSLVPLRKLLSLYAAKCNQNNPLNSALLVGDYSVEVECCQTEIPLNVLTGEGKANGKRRLDVWMELTIKPDDSDDIIVPLVIENKVYAGESKNQTEDYHKAVVAYQNNRTNCVPIEIFLTPDSCGECACKSFIHITYKELLDNVIEPISLMDMQVDAKRIIDDFICNLGKPTAAFDDDRGKDPKTLFNTIVAISSKVTKILHKIYKDHEELFKHALIAEGGQMTSKILPDIESTNTTNELLIELWENNATIFNSILYLFRSEIAKGKENELMNIFKESHRDTSKYIVEVNENGNWTRSRFSTRPLSKGKTVAVFFAEWVKKNTQLHFKDINDIFPTKLNQYYNGRKKNEFDSIIWQSTDNGKNVRTPSNFETPLKDASWDLYPNDPNQDCGLGYCKLDDGDIVFMVKMWRKDEFIKFQKYVKSNPKFEAVRIKEYV